MQFDKLRVVGFKSFAEPADFAILPGLTGIVGPNGCGKSNLVEALRWVMGETSYKSMRASGMEDVIFAGGGNRPGRDVAEVALTLDNSARDAPAAFNESEVLEVARRIGRDAGSTYRVNGREVRARDVQILFADASSGARSPALVRQGQVSEIIAAGPQARRRILEEAAGIAGLHGRRADAERRLKAAAENLLRVDDVLAQITAQRDTLRRQARQTQRYREIQAAIRRTRALQLLVDWDGAERDGRSAATDRVASAAAVEAALAAQSEAARRQGVAAHALTALRRAETDTAIRLQERIAARDTLDGEERHVREQLAELDRELGRLYADRDRIIATLADADDTLARLEREDRDLRQGGDAAVALNVLHDAVTAAETARLEADARLASAQEAWAAGDGRRRRLDERSRENTRRHARLGHELSRLAKDTATLATAASDDGDLDGATARARVAAEIAEAADAEMAAAAVDLEGAREAEERTRSPFAAAAATVQRLETEARTLAKLLGPTADRGWTPISEAVVVAPGLETALGAAFGDDLDASGIADAPTFWADSDGASDPALPGGLEPLVAHVRAPSALRRSLAQVGLARRDVALTLWPQLKPGQAIVTPEGDLWRWDGFRRAAGVSTPAAARLVERNRLGALDRAVATARAALETCRTAAEAAQLTLAAARKTEAAARARARDVRRAADAARTTRDAVERRGADLRIELALARDREAAAARDLDEAAHRQEEIAAAIAALPPDGPLRVEIAALRGHAAARSTAELRARAVLEATRHDVERRETRRRAVAAERAAWLGRIERIAAHQADVTARIAAVERRRDALRAAPDRFVLARARLANDLEQAQAAQCVAGDARLRGEADATEVDRVARETLEALGAARETRARCVAREEACTARRAAVAHIISDELESTPTALPAIAGVLPHEARPTPEAIAVRLDGFKADRERLGAVNLRAEQELAETDTRAENLAREKRDLDEAIRRLRQAVAGLNADGRARLLRAFETVNGHFKALFATLFDGGDAELTLVEADDPLEAGLEIVARPPGKRPQVMSLLSGGEQALTAISLIFAVFLTNPSPICVLDEVDAPLDDSNVERFCDLLDDVRRRTDTRFLAITHNPITMARMDRLYGVTQAERGVSTLVSVDLAGAEALVDA